MRVVVLMQENKSTDYYFPTLQAWGADVQARGKLLAAPPIADPPHDRNAWIHYSEGAFTAATVQINNDVVIPYYSLLAKLFTFCDHHVGLGTNSTPGHMFAIGGQTPTLRNPPSGTHPVWDLPTIFKLVERGGHTWGAFTGTDRYPVDFYRELQTPQSRACIHTSTDPASDQFTKLAGSRGLPDFCFVWSPNGYDEHAPDRSKNPAYIQQGHDLTWQRVQAVVDAGGWDETVFILTWDDWGGYADHVQTPVVETVKDQLHPAGYPILGGTRIPLIMFGGRVKAGIESNWHSHACIPRTVADLLGLGKFGVPRVDTSSSLADRVDAALKNPPPPKPGAVIRQPSPPIVTPRPTPPQPWPGPLSQPMPALVANNAAMIPAPEDAVVTAHVPALPSGLS